MKKAIIIATILIALLLMYIIPVSITGFLIYSPDTSDCWYNSSHPYYPEWNITGTTDCTVSDGTIELLGNLTVYGNLTLNNIRLIFNMTNDAERRIHVYDGGLMNITNSSNITSNNTNLEFLFTVDSGSTFEMRDSYLSECGYAGGGGLNIPSSGLAIKTNNSIIQNNSIYYSYYGIFLYQANNSVLNNNTIYNTTQYGIYLNISSNNTITNNILTNNSIGIRLNSSSNNTVTNNRAYNSTYGIHVDTADSNTLTNNLAYNNIQYGIYVQYSSYNNLTNNAVYDNLIDGFILELGANNTVTNNTAYDNDNRGFYVVSTNNSTIANNTINYSSLYGMSVQTSLYNTITNNVIYNNTQRGIYIYSSSDNNTLSNNIIYNHTNGIYIVTTDNNTITNNTIYDNTDGIYIDTLNNSIITNNTIYSNSYGLYFWDASDNNSITNNTITNNSAYALYVSSSSNNNFTNNTICYNAEVLDNDTAVTIDNNTFCINLLTPTNNTVSTSLTNFTFNVSNPIFTTSCQLYIGGSQKATNSSVYNHNTSLISYTPSGGTHNWYVYCNDSASTNWANSSTRRFRVPYCGDGLCESEYGETCSSCFVDCGSCLGDGGGVGDGIDGDGEEPEDPTEIPDDEITIPEPGTIITIPEGGLSIVLERNVYLNLFGKNATIHNISKIETGRYKVLLCDQASLASYEINITVDLAYFCINYTEANVSEPTISIYKFFENDWRELKTSDIFRNITKKIICGNISSTPYMVAGFNRAPTAAIALEAINSANSSIISAQQQGIDITQAQELLNQALEAYYVECKYTKAIELANRAREILLSVPPQTLFIIFIATLSILAGAWFWYGTVRRRVRFKVGKEEGL